MKKNWSIHIEKDYLKFSAAHFLIFPDGRAERLHGHNYKVFIDLETELDQHGLVLNFREFKPLVPNDSFANRSQNRRVEIRVKYTAGSEEVAPDSLRKLIDAVGLGVEEPGE